jgi:hypothetical protein
MYLGIIVTINDFDYLAPLTSDKQRFYENQQDDDNFYKIYTKDGYKGSLLLCKALPLTKNLYKFESLSDIRNKTNPVYAALCNRQLLTINADYQIIIDKMNKCLHAATNNTPIGNRKINFLLAAQNVAEYNAMKLKEKENKKET